MNHREPRMAARRTHEIRTILLMVTGALIGVGGLVDFIRNKSLVAGIISAFLFLALAIFLYERMFPVGARVLFRNRIRVSVPGKTHVEVMPSSSYRKGRLVIIFDRSKAFYNGTLQIEARNHPVVTKTLPEIKQFQLESLGTYNRALVRDSDRVFVDVENVRHDSTPLSVRLDLAHNVTDPRLKKHLDVQDSFEAEILFKGK